MDFSNASLLSINLQNNFFGDGIARYSAAKQFEIQGYIEDLTNSNGVTRTFSGVQRFIESADDWQPIILHNQSFGSGRVTNLSFDATNYVKFTTYNATIEVYESGNLYNLTGNFYGDLQTILNDQQVQIKFLQNADETFSFSQNKNNAIEVDHSLSLQFYSGDSTNPLDRARYLASQMFNSGTLPYITGAGVDPTNIATGLLYNLYFYNVLSGVNQNLKRFYTENYNLVDNSCSFTEKVIIDPAQQAYFINRTNAISTDENGITTVTEDANIRGLFTPIYVAALSGYNFEINGSYLRCLDVFNYYAPADSYPLFGQFIQKNTTLNQFEGVVNYSVTYSNNPNLVSGYVWEYTNALEKNADNIYNVSEEGTILGMGQINTAPKYNAAISGYNDISGTIQPRCSGFYYEVNGINRRLWVTNQSQSRSPYQGQITYSRSYTDDPAFVDDPKIKKVFVTVSKVYPKHIFETYNVFNQQQLVQIGGNTDLSTDTLQLSLNVARSGSFDRNYYLAYCQSIATGYKATIPYNDPFPRNVSYSFNENQNTMDFSVTYLSFTGKAYTNLSLGW